MPYLGRCLLPASLALAFLANCFHACSPPSAGHTYFQDNIPPIHPMHRHSATRYGRLTSLHRLQCSLVPTLRSKSCRITLCPFFCLSAALEKSEPSTGPNVTCVWARIARSWNSKAPRCLVALLSWRYLDPNASSPASARPCPPSPPPPPPPSNAIQCIHSRSFVRSFVRPFSVLHSSSFFCFSLLHHLYCECTYVPQSTYSMHQVRSL